MTLITGTIITFNEEDHIEACIASLKRVCVEVVVVESPQPIKIIASIANEAIKIAFFITCPPLGVQCC